MLIFAKGSSVVGASRFGVKEISQAIAELSLNEQAKKSQDLEVFGRRCR